MPAWRRTRPRSPRAGPESRPQEVVRLTDLGILAGSADDGYTDADVRRIQVVQELERSGLPSDALASLVRDGRLSLDFLDDAGFRAFAALSDVTFAELSERSGVPIDVLTVLRVAAGGKAAGPDDRVREDELEVLPLVEYQMQLGFRPQAIERALRVYGDSLRRVAEAEAEWWRSEVQEQVLADGGSSSGIAERAREISPRLSDASDRALMAIYHAQQTHVWSTNIVDGVAAALEQAGLHVREEKSPPAMCFLDVTGYTQLTQERGDAAAAALAEKLSRIVQRDLGPARRPAGEVARRRRDVPLPRPRARRRRRDRDGRIARGRRAAAGPCRPSCRADHRPGRRLLRADGEPRGSDRRIRPAGRGPRQRRGPRASRCLAVIDFQPVGEVALKGVSGLVELYSATKVT